MLKARYDAALKPVYATETALPLDQTPGSKPEHLFDFTDGVRLIISRDILNGAEVIHLSASAVPEIYTGPFDGLLLKTMKKHFFELSGVSRGLVFVGLTKESGIPHWYVPLHGLN